MLPARLLDLAHGIADFVRHVLVPYDGEHRIFSDSEDYFVDTYSHSHYVGQHRP